MTKYHSAIRTEKRSRKVNRRDEAGREEKRREGKKKQEKKNKSNKTEDTFWKDLVDINIDLVLFNI